MPLQGLLFQHTQYWDAYNSETKEYQDAMDELTMFVTIGNNEHDDAADSLSQLSMFINGMFVATIQAIHNPMWGGMMNEY